MEKYELDLDSSIKGQYLSSEMIDLLRIVRCSTPEQLQEFIKNCAQFKNMPIDLNGGSLEDMKKLVFGKYQESFMPRSEAQANRMGVLKTSLEKSGVREEDLPEFEEAYKANQLEGVKGVLETDYPEQYAEIAKHQHEFVVSERDQIQSATYEEMSAVSDVLPENNTILIGSGRYYNVANKLYNPNVPEMEKYDFYFAKRDLDFCKDNGMHARYHALLDQTTLQDSFNGKSKETVKAELKGYVKASIDFINEYNKENQIAGKGVITSVDLFNELVSLNPKEEGEKQGEYFEVWQDKFGISTDELMENFAYAFEHKPEGVTYVYNEPFLENSERRAKALETLSKLDSYAKEHGIESGIDTIGTQMHITMGTDQKSFDENLENIRKCFEDLKASGKKVQITEFDMCVPGFAIDENGDLKNVPLNFDYPELQGKNLNPETIKILKTKQMQAISEVIKKTGIELEGVTYWSGTDMLDHNVQRSNDERDEEHKIATRYSGRYGGISASQLAKHEPAREKISTRKLAQQVTAEMGNSEVTDKTNRALESHAHVLQEQKEGNNFKKE